MSKPKETGGSAFPCPQDSINQNAPSLGMTLRDWFAGQALPAILTNTATQTHFTPDDAKIQEHPTGLEGAADYLRREARRCGAASHDAGEALNEWADAIDAAQQTLTAQADTIKFHEECRDSDRAYIASLEATNKQQAEQIVALRAALLEYGRHEVACSMELWFHRPDSQRHTPRPACDCGFDDAAKIAEAPHV